MRRTGRRSLAKVARMPGASGSRMPGDGAGPLHSPPPRFPCSPSPLLTVIGAVPRFVLYTTVGDAINLDRAPNLINATSIPAAKFYLNIQNERKASLVYLAAPTHVNRAQLEAAQAATTRAFPAFQAEMTGPATASAATTTETAVIKQMLDSIQGLSAIRPQILAGAISPTQVFDAFSNILAEQMKLFIVENASLTNATAATQSLAAINSTESGEFLLQEDALVSAALAAHRLTPATRIQVTQLAGARQAMLRAATSRFDAPDLATFNAQMNRYAPPAVQSDLAQLENAIAADPTGSFPPIKAAEWNPVVQREASGLFFGGVTAARQQVQHDSTITNTAWRRVALAGGVGLLGLVLSVLLSVLIGRWIIRRLGRARRVGDRPGRSRTAQRGRPAPPRRGRARRGTERDDRGPGPGRDRAGRPGVRRGPPHRHRGRGRRGPDAARDRRRVPQRGPAQPVAAAPATRGAGRHGAAHDGLGNAGRPLPPRPPHDPHAPPLRRPDHLVRGGTGPRLGAPGPDDRRARPRPPRSRTTRGCR